RIAVFYQDNEYGRAALEGIQQALKKHKLQPVAMAAAKDQASDVAGAASRILETQPQTVILAAPWMSAAPFIQVVRASDPNTGFWGISLLGSRALTEEMGKEAAGVQISQVLPAPWDEQNPVVQEYSRLFLKES